MKVAWVKVESDITNWPAVAAGLSLALFMGVVIAVSMKAPLVVIVILAVVGAVSSSAAWIDAVWEGYERGEK